MGYATTKLSSKGQVVIPEEIRESLGLEVGAQFVVIGEGDTVILKALTRPDLSQMKGLLSQSRSAARKARLKPSAVREAIRKSRKG